MREAVAPSTEARRDANRSVRALGKAPRRPFDFYATGAEAVATLRARVRFPEIILEPCNGDGAISRPFRDAHQVITNDLDAAKPADTHIDASGLRAARGWAVVSNPPFSVAFEIVRNFVDQGNQVAMLLRMSFMEPTYDRGDWLAAHPPSGLIVLPRYSFTADGKTDSVTCGWHLWNMDPEPRIQVVSKGVRPPRDAKGGSDGEGRGSAQAKSCEMTGE